MSPPKKKQLEGCIDDERQFKTASVHKGYWWYLAVFVDRKNKTESYFYSSF